LDWREVVGQSERKQLGEMSGFGLPEPERHHRSEEHQENIQLGGSSGGQLSNNFC
jgi:hypothetical protein